MNEYKLDTHLQKCCSENPEYMNLYSTWNLNKKTCSEALKTVLINYPHFSMHDASHAEAAISKMEMLLGNRVHELSPTDTWLLLHAAYTHDLGMVLQWEEIEKAWETQEFQKFISSLTNDADNELRNAAIFILNVKEQVDSLLWPLKAHRYVNLINASYFRSQHAHISRKYIGLLGKGFEIDLGHSSLIQPRLVNLLGRICELHIAPTAEVLLLDYQTDGFGSDYCHPRFVAMMLRVSDLLDIDNGRFNAICELVAGGLPETSLPHKEKHNATTHLLVTPREIQFSSDCPNPKAYLETRNFVSWLETEVDFLTKHWAQIVPEKIGGYAPRFEKKELLLDGIPDIEGVAGLRFEISQEKAFQIIEGSNIYKDRFIFIREVIQNAMDASKMQLWNDLISNIYHAWIGDKDYAKLQPYDLDIQIYKSYPIQVKLLTLPDGMTQIEVSDRGTGISVDTFKRMCKVGASNSDSQKMQAAIREMPNWLRPTAGFGVGLQSIFLMTDQFEIDTSTSVEAFHAVVHSNRMGGYLQLQRAAKHPLRGTTIRIKFRMPEQFRFSMFGDTYNYLSFHLDPMSSESHTGEARVLEAIKSNCGDTLLPIRIDCAENYLGNFEIMDELPVCHSNVLSKWETWKERYRFYLEKDCSNIQIWDMEQAAYGEFHMILRDQSGTRFLFKGIEVNNQKPRFWLNGMNALIDIYGMDTKDTISLDRSAFTEQGAQQVGKILADMFDVYIECVLRQLTSQEFWADICGSPNFNIYTFWLMCNPEQRKQIPQDVLAQIKESATVIVKEGENRYVKQEKLVSELISFEDTYFLNLDKFDKHIGVDSIDYEQICSILNRAETLAVDLIIADKVLTEAANCSFWKTLLKPVPDDVLFLYTVSSSQDKPLLSTDSRSKNTILRGLSEYITGMSYNNQRQQSAKRHAIPALEEYGDLIIEKIPYGLAMPFGGTFYPIIAPFNREEAEKRIEMSKDGFIEFVMSSATTFNMVVNYVLKHSPQKETLTKEKVLAGYQRLIGDYYDILSNSECLK